MALLDDITNTEATHELKSIMARVRFTLQRRYCVYVDYTTEEQPRPYYVGKGVESRVNRPERNRLHKHFRSTHGFQRVVVFETDDELAAYAHEKQLIQEHRTYAHGGDGWWGANLDLGGQGGPNTPKRPEHRAKIRQAHLGVPKSMEHRAAMSEGGKGKLFSETHRANLGKGQKLAIVNHPELREVRRLASQVGNKIRWSKPLTEEGRQIMKDAARLGHARKQANGKAYPKRSESCKQLIRTKALERAARKRFRKQARSWFTRLQPPKA